jgi:hypothetical protein
MSLTSLVELSPRVKAVRQHLADSKDRTLMCEWFTRLEKTLVHITPRTLSAHEAKQVRFAQRHILALLCDEEDVASLGYRAVYKSPGQEKTTLDGVQSILPFLAEFIKL